MNDKVLEPITQEEIDKFSKKLAEWGKTLSAKESAVLQLMLDQSEGNEGELSDKNLEGVTGGMRVAASKFLGSTTMAAHGTSKKTNEVTKDALGRPSWDTDSEWDYSPT
jgi:hypothetical protein